MSNAIKETFIVNIAGPNYGDVKVYRKVYRVRVNHGETLASTNEEVYFLEDNYLKKISEEKFQEYLKNEL